MSYFTDMKSLSNEFSVEWLQKKAISVIATILLIWLFNETKNTNTNKLKQNIQSHDYDTKDLEKDLKKIPKKEIKKAFKKVLSRMTSQLNKWTGERHQIIVPTLLCTAFKIDSPYLSPDEVIDKKIDKAIEWIKTAENQKEQEIYIKTYIDFITLEECLLNTEDTEIFYMKHLCHGHLCVPYKSITAESKLSLLIAI